MEDDKRIRSIAILGGGTAGWVSASLLARTLHQQGCTISVVESPEIGTIGVGEATIPPITDFLKILGINEADFIRHTQATFKLGIKFLDWREPGQAYWHPFGTFGSAINRRPFFHYWHKAKARGWTPHFHDFSLCSALGEMGRFRFPDANTPGPASGLRYALHFDAGLVANYLRIYAERLGVARLEKTVTLASLTEKGHIDALHLTAGTTLSADLFLDCSGFRGLLIEQTLKAGYVEWNRWLPCDRAVAFPTDVGPSRPPYTQARARAAGWQWRIPLQHRAGNGHVYASAEMSDQAALDDLLATLGKPPRAEPRFLRFTTGRRHRFWIGNCVAIGLASGFLEPLESTSIHLAMSGIYNLLDHFPDRDFAPANIASYNDELAAEIEHVRDFIILHYAATQRGDTPFWNHCRTMVLPDSLTERIDLYKATGRVRTKAGALFTDLSWFYIFEGMGITPSAFDPLVRSVDDDHLRRFLGEMAAETAAALRGAPTHDSYFHPNSSALAAAPL
jgi:tryptophan halogenase